MKHEYKSKTSFNLCNCHTSFFWYINSALVELLMSIILKLCLQSKLFFTLFKIFPVIPILIKTQSILLLAFYYYLWAFIFEFKNKRAYFLYDQENKWHSQAHPENIKFMVGPWNLHTWQNGYKNYAGQLGMQKSNSFNLSIKAKAKL